MTEEEGIEVRLVDVWDVETIADLYRAGGWWNERWDPADLTALIEGSFAFVVAVDRTTGKAVGMGRVISDRCSDGYVRTWSSSQMPRQHQNDDLICTARLLP